MSRRDEVRQEPQQQSGGRSIDTTECMCYLGKGGGGGVLQQQVTVYSRFTLGWK